MQTLSCTALCGSGRVRPSCGVFGLPMEQDEALWPLSSIERRQRLPRFPASIFAVTGAVWVAAGLPAYFTAVWPRGSCGKHTPEIHQSGLKFRVFLELFPVGQHGLAAQVDASWSGVGRVGKASHGASSSSLAILLGRIFGYAKKKRGVWQQGNPKIGLATGEVIRWQARQGA
jgi:hypothetical protein